MELLKNLFSEGEALTYDQLTEKNQRGGSETHQHRGRFLRQPR